MVPENIYTLKEMYWKFKGGGEVSKAKIGAMNIFWINTSGVPVSRLPAGIVSQ